MTAAVMMTAVDVRKSAAATMTRAAENVMRSAAAVKITTAEKKCSAARMTGTTKRNLKNPNKE